LFLRTFDLKFNAQLQWAASKVNAASCRQFGDCRESDLPG
jgi:hypothetical protein